MDSVDYQQKYIKYKKKYCELKKKNNRNMVGGRPQISHSRNELPLI